ncbi:protein MAIN-LIKE 1-like [Amaranthus tricolor]|uniref:protein MAIN-LIKE 1-like n=1 Tax=Amaranthus tricolor TaxID=29722 RepID=UPI00258619A6|nr:protein MAIN-LIKE 1-like [Amaranthus tricolor]
MTIILHDMQRILGIGIEGSLPAEPGDGEWKLALTGLFGEPMSELRRKGYFTSGCINVGEVMQMCHRSQALEMQCITYYMAIVGSTLLADKTRTGMRPHPILTVNADQDEIAWGAVTLAYLYRQLGMASKAGCKTIFGCLTLLQTWIFEYFPAFRPHPRQVDVPNKTKVEMWSTPKPGRELSRLRDCRSILDSMKETQVEWIPYITSPRVLLNEHPRTAYIEGITCFDIIEVYLPERTVRQLGFEQAIPPAPMRPIHALRPAQGTYSMTFASPPIYKETWSRFPNCARVGDQFANEFPSRIAPLLRMPVVVDMSPRERQAADLYIDEVRELFADWQASKGQDPS